MGIKTKYNINFRLEQRKDRQTKELVTLNVPINMDFTYEGKRLIYFTGYRIDSEKWIDTMIDSNGEKIKVQKVRKNTRNRDGVQYNEINKRLDELKTQIEDIFIKAKANNVLIDNEYLRTYLQKELREEKISITSKIQFWAKWDEYITTHKVSPLRKRHMESTKNHVLRFEQFTKRNVSYETLNPRLLADFEDYLLKDGYDDTRYSELSYKRKPKPKSQNTVAGILKRFRAFLNWSMQPQNGALLNDNPFSHFQIKGEVYGAPICMTKEERDYLYEKNIEDERLARVRDIFCLQCFFGCRVGDFVTLTKRDIVDGILIYYPDKTKKENMTPARVPLSIKAKAIIAKYDLADGKLAPFISGQKYNKYIKELFQLVELNRPVIQLNPLTMKTEQKMLWEIASSHLARRTFIHILHSKVKDSVIASMSGHVKGSKAFGRYYDVDDDTRQDAIDKYLD